MENRLPYYDGKHDGCLLKEEHHTVVPLQDNNNQDEALKQIPSCGSQPEQLLEQGIEQQKNHQFEVALESFNKALKLYTEQQNRRGIGRALGSLSLTVYSLSEFSQAIAYAERSLEVAREVNDKRLEGQVLGILGNSFRHLGNLPQAIAFGEESLLMMRQLQDQPGEVAALNNIGLAYKALGDLPNAIAYQEQSLEIAQT